LESDPEIENLLLQINKGNIEISHIYCDRDPADEMNVEICQNASKALSIYPNGMYVKKFDDIKR